MAEVWAGQRMSDFLNDELMKEHLNGLLHGWQNAWLDATQVGEREQLWLRTRALRDFIESLQSVVTTGQMAAAQLEQDQNER
jgi:hypothetical protein